MDNSNSGSSYNANSSSVRRLFRECKEMLAEPSTLYEATPLEDNIFEWHFTIRGPKDTEFEGGVYHGRILFPPDYPYRPPDIVFLTRNGRFELEKKICLTISSHHAETWRPSWSIRTVLMALIAFLPTKGDGAIASLDWTPEERRKLAKQSLAFKCERCGKHNMTALPPEDVNEHVKIQDVPEELQVRDSKKTSETSPVSSSSASSSSPPSSPSSSSSPLSPSNHNNADVDSQDFTSTPQVATANLPTAPSNISNQPNGIMMNEDINAFLAANPTLPTARLQVPPVFHETFSQAASPDFNPIQESLDIILSVAVLLIGLLLIRKLYLYM